MGTLEKKKQHEQWRGSYNQQGNLPSVIKSSSIGESKKARISKVPHKWNELLAMMENYTLKLKVCKVMWEFPSAGWLKINTDGASRGNPGRSFIRYCVRDEKGDIVRAVGN